MRRPVALVSLSLDPRFREEGRGLVIGSVYGKEGQRLSGGAGSCPPLESFFFCTDGLPKARLVPCRR